MELVDGYGGDDDRSMSANNTSAFNCRPKTGQSTGFSEHSYGRAIDINAVVKAFADIGWKWGGAWSGTRDYQHFSLSGK